MKLNNEGVKIIKNIVEKHSIDVIIFDSLVRFIEGDEDKSTDIRKTYEHIKSIQEDLSGKRLVKLMMLIVKNVHFYLYLNLVRLAQ